ncbi:hypothetical protein CALCODRAFT_511965 [Calocera cornea HHB12733]|uniref:Uncharacterized protein n=1 Tax=Calocera cornea HHB12733 TaxID=1353952 RepID=A0A165DE55_9BASI|nr:hypothetical protein CALCODRAFT_511965 [Calocera cornea HHB12733]
MTRKVFISEARSGLTIRVVTIRKKFVSIFITKLQESSSLVAPTFFAHTTSLMNQHIGKQLRVPPCWRCRLSFSFAKEAQVVAIDLQYDDKTGWHPMPTWTLNYLREFFASDFDQTGALLLLQGEVEQQ